MISNEVEPGYPLERLVALTGHDLKWLRSHIRSGDLVAVRKGKNYRVRDSDLRRFMAEQIWPKIPITERPDTQKAYDYPDQCLRCADIAYCLVPCTTDTWERERRIQECRERYPSPCRFCLERYNDCDLSDLIPARRRCATGHLVYRQDLARAVGREGEVKLPACLEARDGIVYEVDQTGPLHVHDGAVVWRVSLRGKDKESKRFSSTITTLIEDGGVILCPCDGPMDLEYCTLEEIAAIEWCEMKTGAPCIRCDGWPRPSPELSKPDA